MSFVELPPDERHQFKCQCGGPRDYRAKMCRSCDYAARGTRARASLRMRVEARIDRSGGPDACWPWLGYRKPGGYGQIARNRSAHRSAYEMFVGPIPDGLDILHSCDNPPCCNPNHLHPGSHADNMAEAAERHRMPFGQQMHNAKLNPDRVREIRNRLRMGESRRSIARSIGVAPGTVIAVALGLTWRHVA
jgi:hypothetical protein